MPMLLRPKRPEIANNQKPLTITPPIREIIERVAQDRLTSTELLAAIFEYKSNGELRYLRKILRDLWIHYYVEQPAEAIAYRIMNEYFYHIYGLGDKGYSLIYGERTRHQSKRTKRLKHTFVDHTLATSRFRTTLELAVRNHPELQITSWKREDARWLLKMWPGELSRDRRSRPDATFVLVDRSPEQPQRPMYFAIEIDRAHSEGTYVLEKYKAYARSWKEGIHKTFWPDAINFRVLTITPKQGRAARLAELVRQAHRSYELQGAGLFWFASEDQWSLTNPEPLLGKIWALGRDHNLYSIRDRSISTPRTATLV